jgi:hypothetical protein
MVSEKGKALRARSLTGEQIPNGIGMPRTAAGATHATPRALSAEDDTVVRFERGEELKDRTVAAMQEALERAGVEFIAEDESSAGGGPGVRLAKPVRRRRAK